MKGKRIKGLESIYLQRLEPAASKKNIGFPTTKHGGSKAGGGKGKNFRMWEEEGSDLGDDDLAMLLDQNYKKMKK